MARRTPMCRTRSRRISHYVSTSLESSTNFFRWRVSGTDLPAPGLRKSNERRLPLPNFCKRILDDRGRWYARPRDGKRECAAHIPSHTLPGRKTHTYKTVNSDHGERCDIDGIMRKPPIAGGIELHQPVRATNNSRRKNPASTAAIVA